MKVWINDQCYDGSHDWTAREERTVYRLLQLRPGEWWGELLAGSTVPAVASAIVAHMRAKPGVDVDFLADAKGARPDGFPIDDGEAIRVKVDFSDEENKPGPPAKGAAVTKPRRAAKKSPRKS